MKGYGFTELSKTYDKFLDKIQQKEVEIPLHQMEPKRPLYKEVLQYQHPVQHKVTKSYFL